MSKLKEMFDKCEDDGCEFEKIENPRSRRPDLHAFLLLEEICPGKKGTDLVSSAAHDQIWLNVDIKKLQKTITQEQVLELVRCGVWLDDEVDSLSMFV